MAVRVLLPIYLVRALILIDRTMTGEAPGPEKKGSLKMVIMTNGRKRIKSALKVKR